ncbi:hypothetical protein ZIOFF_045601 [Zingiber officinale]|uniref:Dof zinc finger protein n=1 Tax=Zingiber officinale TaxID=94328 RepID=A0A8J5KYH7_ZINOF|nr:hypothetical protein ZIOFF_045601 [Zingiber officinale]
MSVLAPMQWPLQEGPGESGLGEKGMLPWMEMEEGLREKGAHLLLVGENYHIRWTHVRGSRGAVEWGQKQRAHPQLSNSFVAVDDGQYEAGAPVRPSESSAVAKMASRPSPDQHAVIECPRCNSTNTKFCYYNNYSRSQPRHFCKTCRRYWTHGGALRNVPVGGGSRRSNKQTAKHSKPQTATANYTSPSLSVASMRPPPLLINNNNNNNDNHNHPVIHNFGVGQQLPPVGMAAAPQPCPNPFTSFGEENNVGVTVKMENIGYDHPRVQFSYDPSNINNYNDMFTCGDSGSMSSCIAWPSATTGFSYGSSSPHHLTFMNSDLP